MPPRKDLKIPTKPILRYFKDALHFVSGNYFILLINCFIYTFVIAILPITILGLLLVPALHVSYTKIFFIVCAKKQLCIPDSMSYGFLESRWLKSLQFYAASVLARVAVLSIAVILFLSTFNPPLTGLWKYIPTFTLPVNTPFAPYLAIATIVLLALFALYLSLIWGFGLYLLVEENLSRTITVKDMFLQSHKIAQTVGLWRLLTIDLVIAAAVYIISKTPVIGSILPLLATPLISMVRVSVYLHNKN